MATIRPGARGVLLVVDLQVGNLGRAWNRAAVIERAAHAVERARASGVPVVWVQHEDEELVRDTPAWQWVPELVPAPGEPRIDKRWNSAFEETPLEATLAGLGATHVVLCGAASNWCIRHTAHAALERGYDLTLLEDAHTTGPMRVGGGVEIDPALLVAELNVAFTWRCFPGRVNAVATAAAVDFDRPVAIGG